MKTIGFVDYYISEWHANNYPIWFKEIAEKSGKDFVVKYAWAEQYVSPVDGRNTDETTTTGSATRMRVPLLRQSTLRCPKTRHGMRVSDKRYTVGRKLLPKTPRWKAKEVQCIRKDTRRMRNGACQDDRTKEKGNRRP